MGSPRTLRSCSSPSGWSARSAAAAAYARTATIRMPRRSRRAEANKNPGTDAGVFAAAQRAALTPPHRYNMGTNGMNGSAGSISIAGTTGLLAEVADSTNSSAMIARPMPAVQ